MSRQCYLCDYNARKKDPEVCMHKFPKDARTRAAWFKVCGFEEGIDDVHGVRICSQHFASDDFFPATTTLAKPVIKLKSGRVPSRLKVRKKAIADQRALPSTCTATECIKQTTCASALCKATSDCKEELFEVATTSQKTSDAAAPTYATDDYTNILGESSAGLLFEPERSSEQGVREVTTSEDAEPLQEEVLPGTTFLLNVPVSVQADASVECSELEDLVLETCEIVETKRRKTTSHNIDGESSAGRLFEPELSCEEGLGEVTVSLQEEVLPGTTFLLNVPHSIQADPSIERSELEEVVPEASEKTSRKRKFAEPRYVSEIEEADLATLSRTKRILYMVKKTDREKTRKIKMLQNQNRYLKKKVIELQKWLMLPEPSCSSP